MKKTIFKSIALLFTIPLFLTSCLGDTVSQIRPENSLAYISRDGFYSENIAFTQEGLYIKDSYIDNLRYGNFYYLSYKWSSKDPSFEGVFTVSECKAGKGGAFPIQKNNDSFRAINLTNYPTAFQSELEYAKITEVDPFYYSPYKVLGDNWVIKFTCGAYEEDFKEEEISVEEKRNNLKPIVVFQESAQNGKDNQAILNVFIERVNPNLPVDKTKPQVIRTFLAVVDMSHVRQYLMSKNTDLGDKTKESFFQFQYYPYELQGGKLGNKYSEQIQKNGMLPNSEYEESYGQGKYGMVLYNSQD